METIKFKVGDKVRVKSLKWYNENKNEVGRVLNEDASRFLLKEMSRFCGRTLQIKSIIEDDGYIMCENNFFWQDWMLEDEPVTEEKKEVEQLNKNDMEIKEMTQEEVFAYLNNTKILCTSTDKTTKVQKKLFKLGIEWGVFGKAVDEDVFLLFISNNRIEFTHDIEAWVISNKKQIEPSEILAIQLKEEKPKFDPKTLKPFDRVLVRDIAENPWLCTLFSHIEKEDFICTSSFWKCCIPYNEDTKHLVGTTEEAPEFYNIWKK